MKFDFCPYTALSEIFSSKMFSYTVNQTVRKLTYMYKWTLVYFMCENFLSAMSIGHTH